MIGVHHRDRFVNPQLERKKHASTRFAVPEKGLTGDEQLRYARQVIMPEIGANGQVRMKESSVLVVGMGGLGTAASTYLASMGVGRIGIVDFDVIEMSNLNRQVFYSSNDIGRKKVEIAKERLATINPSAKIDAYDEKLSVSNVLDIVRGYDIVIDGTDNMPARYLMSDAGVILDKQNVYASIFRFEGEITVFVREGPCYRCLHPEPPAADYLASMHRGVVGFLPGAIGAMEAGVAVNLILRNGASLVGRLILVSGSDMKFTEIRINRNPNCSSCGRPPKLKRLDEAFYRRFA
jgi:adenylyltransferase/sulfurtransferase